MIADLFIQMPASYSYTIAILFMPYHYYCLGSCDFPSEIIMTFKSFGTHKPSLCGAKIVKTFNGGTPSCFINAPNHNWPLSQPTQPFKQIKLQLLRLFSAGNLCYNLSLSVSLTHTHFLFVSPVLCHPLFLKDICH